MTTQFERDMERHDRETMRDLALVEAATKALDHIEDEEVRAELDRALQSWSLKNLRAGAEYVMKRRAEKQAEVERKQAGSRLFEELPDAPPRMQCHAQVARDMGRWTDFGRCEKPATRIVLDRAARRERVLCMIHAKEWADRECSSRPVDPYWWYDHPSHLLKTDAPSYARGNPVETSPHWYRGQGWCMAKRVSDGAYCKVRADKGSGKHEGKEHRFA